MENIKITPKILCRLSLIINKMGISSFIMKLKVESGNEDDDKRELVKVSVLKNCFDDPREIAEVLAERTRSEVVQVIGKKIVLYKPAKENSKIVLP